MINFIPTKSTNLMTSEEFFDLLWKNELFKNNIDIFKKTYTFKAAIKETRNLYIIEADLPGVNIKDIEIYYFNNFLVVDAIRRKEDKETEIHDFLIEERSFGKYRRMFYINNINTSKIFYNFNNGQLKLSAIKV